MIIPRKISETMMMRGGFWRRSVAELVEHELLWCSITPFFYLFSSVNKIGRVYLIWNKEINSIPGLFA